MNVWQPRDPALYRDVCVLGVRPLGGSGPPPLLRPEVITVDHVY